MIQMSGCNVTGSPNKIGAANSAPRMQFYGFGFFIHLFAGGAALTGAVADLERSMKHMKTIGISMLTYLTTVVSQAATAEATLMHVPERIEAFRAKIEYGKFFSTADMLLKKWEYVHFLEALIKEVNLDVTSGDALSEKQIEAIGSFAQLKVILRDGYMPSTTRGTSGFGAREVDLMIELYEQVLRDFIPTIGKRLSVYHKTEKDWDEVKVEEWLREFSSATKIEPADGANDEERDKTAVPVGEP